MLLSRSTIRGETERTVTELRNMCEVSLDGKELHGKCGILRLERNCSHYQEYNSQFRVGSECAFVSNSGSCMNISAVEENTPPDVRALLKLEEL